MAQRLSAAGPKAPLMTRLDSGLDPAALMVCVKRTNQAGQVQVDFLIKWNPRSLGCVLDIELVEHVLVWSRTACCWMTPNPSTR